MKHLIFIPLIIIFLFSCSKNKQSGDLNEMVCSRLHVEQLTPKAILITGEEVKKSLAKEGKLSFKDYIASNKDALENCFRTIKYKKTILNKPEAENISGSAARYLRLESCRNDIYLDERESSSFLFKFKLVGVAKSPDTSYPALSGKLILFNKDSGVIQTYNIDMTQDVKKMLADGRGETWLKVILPPVWSSFSNDPFALAAASLDKMDSAAKYEVVINLNGEETSSAVPGNKKLDAILNDLDKAANDYSNMIDKALNDDLYSMAHYTDSYKIAQDKLASAKNRSGNMNQPQKQRLSEIEEKINKARDRIK